MMLVVSKQDVNTAIGELADRLVSLRYGTPPESWSHGSSEDALWCKVYDAVDGAITSIEIDDALGRPDYNYN